MTPVEVFEYKRQWMPGSFVSVHSDMFGACKIWCKTLAKEEWNVTVWSDVYEHTFHFERPEIAEDFKKAFGRWTT
jgi:hypothetical protein